jgi:hypothetical protein
MWRVQPEIEDPLRTRLHWSMSTRAVGREGTPRVLAYGLGQSRTGGVLPQPEATDGPGMSPKSTHLCAQPAPGTLVDINYRSLIGGPAPSRAMHASNIAPSQLDLPWHPAVPGTGHN